MIAKGLTIILLTIAGLILEFLSVYLLLKFTRLTYETYLETQYPTTSSKKKKLNDLGCKERISITLLAFGMVLQGIAVCLSCS